MEMIDPGERLVVALERIAAALEAQVALAAPKRASVVLQPREVDEIGEIVAAAQDRFGGGIWCVAELTVGASHDSPTFRAHVGRVLGRAVKAGHVAHGFRVDCAGEKHATKLWRLRAVGRDPR
jgi:hypothetical protein